MTEPTYRPGDVVLCKGVVRRTDSSASVYVAFPGGSIPQLTEMDIVKVEQWSVKVGDSVQFDGESGAAYGTILGIRGDDIWLEERVSEYPLELAYHTLSAAEVRRY